jgi:mannose-6-phosphate isomerase-like protein (cupin superfamily)
MKRFFSAEEFTMSESYVVIPATAGKVDEFPWGRLHWIANDALVIGAAFTFGECLILPGQQNARHAHPNCDEVLFVISGECEHFIRDESIMLKPGMALYVKSGAPHYARCTSWEPLKAVIAYSTPNRQTQNVP